MQADEYQALVDSINTIGVQNPITTYDGMVLDGWNRYSAALETSAPCPSVELGDVDPRDFVLAQNKARRNLTASQRAAAVTSVYEWMASTGVNQHSKRGGEATSPPPKTNAELAVIAGTTTRTIQQAKATHEGAIQAVQDAVKSGEISVETGAAVAKLSKKKQQALAPKGGDAMRAAVKPAIAKPEHVAAPEDDGPDAAELAANAAAAIAAAHADAVMVQKLLESDAPLADALAENKRLNAEVAALRQRLNGLMSEKNEAIALVKSRDRTIAKLEKLATV